MPTANGDLYEIGHGDHRVVVAGLAATLLSYRLGDEELLLTHPPEAMGEGYQGKTILPWPNRIDRGRYEFDGVVHDVPVNERERDTALHGLLSFTAWHPLRHSENSVTLAVRQYPSYGYPFALEFETEYALGPAGLTVTLNATNVGPNRAPFGTAHHLYLAAPPESTVDTIGLRTGAAAYYPTDERLVPTGRAPVADTPYDFRTARELGPAALDTAFTDLTRGPDGRAEVHCRRPGGTDVTLWLDAAYDYLQLYTDDGAVDHRPRSGIAIEPVSCAPNAFNTGDGLVVLEPGARWHGTFGLRVPA